MVPVVKVCLDRSSVLTWDRRLPSVWGTGVSLCGRLLVAMGDRLFACWLCSCLVKCRVGISVLLIAWRRV